MHTKIMYTKDFIPLEKLFRSKKRLFTCSEKGGSVCLEKMLSVSTFVRAW